MAQQMRDEGFEDPNSGVAEPELQDAGPGMIGKILSKFSHVKERAGGQSAGSGSTPSGVETRHESKGEDLQGSSPSSESAKDSEDGEVPRELAPPGQQHKNAVGLDTAGAEGRVGDGVETSPVGAPPGSSRPVETGASPRGSVSSLRDEAPASPQLPRKDLGERIIDKLPGSNTNPYSVGNPTPPQGANPYTEGDQSAVPTSPSVQPSAPSSPGLFGKLKNIVTGQKPTQGTATGNASSGTAGTTGEQEPLMHGYTQSPTPEKTGDIFGKPKEKLGRKGPDTGSEETWPSPTKPDLSTITGATYTNAEGQPIEGPTQPKAEDTKKEGLMTKLMDKRSSP